MAFIYKFSFYVSNKVDEKNQQKIIDDLDDALGMIVEPLSCWQRVGNRFSVSADMRSEYDLGQDFSAFYKGIEMWGGEDPDMYGVDECDVENDDDDEQNASHDIVVYNLHVEGKDKKFITALQTALSDFSKEHDISINNEMRTSYEGRAFIYTGNLELKCQSCRTKEVRQMFIEKFGDEYDPDYMGTETV